MWAYRIRYVIPHMLASHCLGKAFRDDRFTVRKEQSSMSHAPMGAVRLQQFVEAFDAMGVSFMICNKGKNGE